MLLICGCEISNNIHFHVFTNISFLFIVLHAFFGWYNVWNLSNEIYRISGMIKVDELCSYFVTVDLEFQTT